MRGRSGNPPSGWALIKPFAWLGLLALFLWLFHTRYFRWRDCFNEAGRCYDPDGSGDVYTTGGWFWIIPAAVFLSLAIAAAIRNRAGNA